MSIEKGSRVKFLFRVSSGKQMDEEEIPLQEKARDKMLLQHPDWVYCGEEYEKGISAYKTAVADRDVLQKIIKEAENGEYDILALFAPDRLCRIQDDYTPTLRHLSKYVSVWTFSSGDITIRNHTDALKASIDGWSNEGESLKTSMRTDEKHKQMAEDGIFRGGSVPYGYKLISSGRYSKRDKKQRKELYDIIVDEAEAEVVRLMFQLADEYKYGGNRIANYLSDMKIYNKSGGLWSATTIKYILKNPMYKGFPAYGKSSSKKGELHYTQPKNTWTFSKEQVLKLVIISEEIWDRVNKERQKRKLHSEYKNVTSSELLLTGLIKCGHCGHTLVTTHHTKKYKTKDGIEKIIKTVKYRCSGKQVNKNICDGGSIYDKKRIEEPVLKFTFAWLEAFGKQTIPKEYYDSQKFLLNKVKRDLTEYNKQKELKTKELTALNNEITKILLGDSPLTREQISELIKSKTKELEESNLKCIELENEIESAKYQDEQISTLKQVANEFPIIFKKAPLAKQKVLLRYLLESVTVTKNGNRISLDIEINVRLSKLMAMLSGVQSSVKWEHTLHEMTYQNIKDRLSITIDIDKLGKVV